MTGLISILEIRFTSYHRYEKKLFINGKDTILLYGDYESGNRSVNLRFVFIGHEELNCNFRSTVITI